LHKYRLPAGTAGTYNLSDAGTLTMDGREIVRYGCRPERDTFRARVF
jgi:hypothetical protein